MKIHARTSTFVAAIGLFMALGGSAWADKGVVVIKSGPIKPTSGNEPGTGKDIITILKLVRPPKDPLAPPIVTMTFDLLTDSKDAKGRSYRYQLSGKGRTKAGNTTTWELRKWKSGIALYVNGKLADRIQAPLLADPKRLLITAYSNPIDTKAFPYGPWKVEGGNEHRKEEPPVVLVPYPTPLPIPFPVPPSGG